MITALDPASQQFVANVDNLQSTLSNDQIELSSGLRVNKPSDAPQQLGDIFQTRANLSQVTQIDQNLNIAKSQADAADTSLQSAVQILQNAAVLGTQGASTTTSATQLSVLANQVQDLESQLVGLSRTEVDGVYIFSGDDPTQPAYQVDTNSPTGVDRLITPAATAQMLDPTGITFPIAKTAQDLFDQRDASDNPTANNAFAALANLQAALQSGDQTQITQAIDGVQTAGAYLNQQLGFYGTVQDRINSSIDLANKFEVQSQTQLSSLQDADVTTIAEQLTQTTTDMNAAMSAQARRPTTSLFDYLPVS